jgi:hypothetical protein
MACSRILERRRLRSTWRSASSCSSRANSSINADEGLSRPPLNRRSASMRAASNASSSLVRRPSSRCAASIQLSTQGNRSSLPMFSPPRRRTIFRTANSDIPSSPARANAPPFRAIPTSSAIFALVSAPTPPRTTAPTVELIICVPMLGTAARAESAAVSNFPICGRQKYRQLSKTHPGRPECARRFRSEHRSCPARFVSSQPPQCRDRLPARAPSA